jgi:translation initiation factor 1
MPFTIGGEWIPDEKKEKAKPIKIRKERRGNTIVTIISSLPLKEEELKKLCSQLKQRLGCGGSVKEENLELQGDKTDQVKTLLQKKGFSIKN